MIETINIKNSSAIAKITFNDDKNIVGICFTSNIERSYDFYCDTFLDIKTKIIETNSFGESVGKLIHHYRKNGTLEALVND